MFKTRASTSRVALYAVLAVLLEGNLWAQEAETPRPEHPRPDFQREKWLNLNGLWLFRTDEGELGLEEAWFSESLDDENILSLYESIQVPFPWQSKLSLQKISQTESAWYRRSFEIPTDWHGERVFVVFGAIDHWAELWLNGQRLGEHEQQRGRGHVAVAAKDLPRDLQPAAAAEAEPLVHGVEDPRDTRGT